MKNGNIDINLIKKKYETKNKYYEDQLSKLWYLKQKIIENFLNNNCKLIYKELYFIRKRREYCHQKLRKSWRDQVNQIRYLNNKEYYSLRGKELSYIHRHLDIKEELIKCNYQCEICLKEIDEKTARMDHIHGSTKFRGLLCNTCNTRLGMFEKGNALFKNNEWIKFAIVYLQKRGGNIPEKYIDYLRILKELLIRNNYECEICHKHIDEKTSLVDNFQNSRIYRGLLCNECNKTLHLFEKDYHFNFYEEEWVKLSIAYLKKYHISIPKNTINHLRIIKELLIRNNYECEICHKHIDEKASQSNKFGGLLCHACNHKLDMFEQYTMYYRDSFIVQNREWFEEYTIFHNEEWVRAVTPYLKKYSVNSKSILGFFKAEGLKY